MIHTKFMSACTELRALCIRRTRTFYNLFIFIYFLAYIDLRAKLERDPESDRLGHPPPTHHDPMKIYRVYRYLHPQKYSVSDPVIWAITQFQVD